MILKLIKRCCKERYATIAYIIQFFSRYVTSMFKCLELEAYLQCSTGKSDLTCLFYPHLGTPNTFLLTQNPAMVSCHTAETPCAWLHCGAPLHSAALGITGLCCLGFATILLLHHAKH